MTLLDGYVALLDDTNRDNRLDDSEICESSISDEEPSAIRYDIAPSNFSVLHVHRPPSTDTGRRRRGGGLAIIYKNDLVVRPLKSKCSPTSFELQLVDLQVSKVSIKIANIYRPPKTSEVIFLNEFADLLLSIATGLDERLVVCGDFNMPGADPFNIDCRLFELLDTLGYRQHVAQPTRHDKSGRTSNLLDLLITPQSTTRSLVSNVGVFSSHGLSDHDLVRCDLSIRRHKPAAIRYSYRDIRNIDVVEFVSQPRSSKLFTDPVDTTDGYVDQFEMTVVDVLDALAPLRTGIRPGGRKEARCVLHVDGIVDGIILH